MPDKQRVKRVMIRLARLLARLSSLSAFNVSFMCSTVLFLTLYLLLFPVKDDQVAREDRTA